MPSRGLSADDPVDVSDDLAATKVSEFGEKKEVARVLEQKELKVVGLTQEVNGLRSLIRSKDRTIFAFKRELSSMVHLGLSKDLEQAVKVRTPPRGT